MAAAFGRPAGKVGVCIATSGPGVTNLVSGLATATSEGDAVLAIGGEVPIDERLKKAHQSLDATNLMKAATKYSAEIVSVAHVGEVIGNAIRVAESGRPKAVFVSLPKDIGLADYPGNADAGWGQRRAEGPGAEAAIAAAAENFNSSQHPVAVLGLQSSAGAIRDSLVDCFRAARIPHVSTFQGLARRWLPQEVLPMADELACSATRRPTSCLTRPMPSSLLGLIRSHAIQPSGMRATTGLSWRLMQSP